eukprot:NODE_269_length_12236_cov_0.516932.p4 type:complete len:443 gc:universal NODE_269_length_12236_cov_0.516932:1933-3261(+)
MESFTLLVDESVFLDLPYDFFDIVIYKRDEYILHNGDKIPFEWPVLNTFRCPRFVCSIDQPPPIVFEKCKRWISFEFSKTLISYMWSNYPVFLTACYSYFNDNIPNQTFHQHFQFITSTFQCNDVILNEINLIKALTSVSVTLEPEKCLKKDIKDLLSWLNENVSKELSVQEPTKTVENKIPLSEQPCNDTFSWKKYHGKPCYERVYDYCRLNNKLCQFKYKFNPITKEYLYKVLIDGVGSDIKKTKSSAIQAEAQDYCARSILKDLILSSPNDFAENSTNFVEQLTNVMKHKYNTDLEFKFIDIGNGLFNIKAICGTNEYPTSKIYQSKEFAMQDLSNDILSYIQGFANINIKRPLSDRFCANKNRNSKYRSKLNTFLDQSNTSYNYDIMEHNDGSKVLYTAILRVTLSDQNATFEGEFRHVSKNQAKEEVAQAAYHKIML